MTRAVLLALPILVLGTSGMARADTVGFTYTLTGQSATTGQPPTLNEEFTGTAAVVPLGTANYTDSGTLTLGQFPNDGFGAMSLVVDYTFSFNKGVDTFFGMDSVTFGPPDKKGVQVTTATMTITGGTGIFSGATGSGSGSATVPPPPATGPNIVTIVGSGDITAPGLAAIPEPSSIMLLGTSVAGLAGIVAMRKKRRTAA
jgi:PEP-CTERM motif-containing protein